MSKEKPHYKYEADPGKPLTKRQKLGVGAVGVAALLVAGTAIDSRLDNDRVFNPITQDEQLRQYASHVQDGRTLSAGEAESIRAEIGSPNIDESEGNVRVTYPTSDEGFNYTVQVGDSPSGIAKKYTSTQGEYEAMVEEIQLEDGQDNMLHPADTLHIGDAPVKVDEHGQPLSKQEQIQGGVVYYQSDETS